MCHNSCNRFGEKVFNERDINGKSVLEVGALNVNGSLRSVIEKFKPRGYVGIDIKDGLGVDYVLNAKDVLKYFGYEKFGVVVATEILEHVVDWKAVIHNLKSVLNPDGIIIITTRSKGFRLHGYPFDFWRFEISDMSEIFSDFIIEALETDPSYPGVFIKARKPAAFKERDLSKYKLYSIVKNNRALSANLFHFYLFRVVNIVRRYILRSI